MSSLAILSVVMVWWKRESSVTVATKTSVKTTVALVQIQGMAKSANLDPAKSAVPAKAHVAQQNVLSRPIMRCADQILSVPMRAGVVEILLYVLPHSQRRISPFVIKIHKFASMGPALVLFVQSTVWRYVAVLRRMARMRQLTCAMCAARRKRIPAPVAAQGHRDGLSISVGKW